MTYNAVKAAEISLAKSLAQQLASSNIRVNSISPGSILFEGGSWWKRQQENPEAIADFEKLAGTRGTVLDLFDREQYRDFHGTEPPPHGARRRRKTSGAPPETNGRTLCSVRARVRGSQDYCPKRRADHENTRR